MRAYADTSATVKLYAPEKHSELVIEMVAIDALRFVTIAWTANETVAALDKKIAKRQLTVDECEKAIELFLRDFSQWYHRNKLIVLPITDSLLLSSMDLIRKHHISADDALQLATALSFPIDFFVAGDKRLVEAARAEGIETYNLEVDADAQLLKQKLKGYQQDS
jgi:predicted nucleic acid-binding protein